MQLVANLGFPAIVTMYLLVRIEGKLESLSIGGKLSKLLGSNTNNISLYISFTLCFLLIIVGIIYFWIPKNEREKNILEFWNLIIPIITATLGYIFGRNN